MSEIIHGYLNNTHKTSSRYLLMLRLWFNCLIFCFMIFMLYILLKIDFAGAKDPLVRMYHYNRWLLITTWFNVISVLYTPICIYCDWREFRRTDDVKHVKILNQIRFVCFTSILFPVTCFSDVFFWKLWTKNRDLVAPAAVDALVPMWIHHVLHTVSLVVTIVDLLSVPRRRPKNLKLGVIILTLFLTAYAFTCGCSIVKNQHIYPLLRLFSGYNYVSLILYVSIEHFFYFMIQWLVMDLVWSRGTQTHELVSLLSFSSRHLEIGEDRKFTETKSNKDTIRSRQNNTKKLKTT